MNFGDKLKNLRIKKGLTQEDVASKINVHRATIGKYENEERFPDKNTLNKIADFYDVSVDYLLGRKNNPNPDKIDDPPVSTKAFHSLGDLSEEEIADVEKYIEFIKLKRKNK